MRYMHRVAQPDVGRGHVDLGAQGAGAVGELAGAHALEEVEALVDGAVAVEALFARAVGGAAHLVDLFGGVVADEGLALADELQRVRVERLEVVGGVEGLDGLAGGFGRHDRRQVEVVSPVGRGGGLRGGADRLEGQDGGRPSRR